MGTFSASLRAIGDVKALPATVELSDGQLRIVAGSTEIGSWPLSEIRLEQIPTGYRMVAEGEQILLEFKDLDSFATELGKASKKRRARSRSAATTSKTTTKTSFEDVVSQSSPIEVPEQPVPIVEQSIPAPVSKDKPAPPSKRAKTSSDGSGTFRPIDAMLIKAKKRFGAVLPDFVFSRAMFIIAVAALVVMVLMPSIFSNVLLIVGALTVLFGAVVYSDSVLASRWLPGRATPQQALLVGLGVLLLGVLLGFLAK